MYENKRIMQTVVKEIHKFNYKPVFLDAIASLGFRLTVSKIVKNIMGKTSLSHKISEM